MVDDDQRSRFQRDRDRVLYTTALRRLAGITQVASAGEAHVFHNRLTHTLEVAQIARRLAEDLAKRHTAAASALGGIDADVVECAALAHDLGHPPFGHIAEKLLDKLMVNSHVRDGFEGNAQSFRIVTKLAVRDRSEGLDLTRASLNALLKYPTLQKQRGPRIPKWGAYRTESEDFNFARALGPKSQTSVEAEIMDLADDIGYAVHDVEDFYRGGLVPLERLSRRPLSGDLNEEREWFFQAATLRWERVGKRPDFPDEQLQTAFTALVEFLPIDAPFTGMRKQRAAVRTMTASLIARYIRSATLNATRGPGQLAVVIPDDVRCEIEMLKELTWAYVIDNPSLATQQHGQRHIIEQLFEIYSNRAAAEELAIFPPSTRERLEVAGNDHQQRLRIVCDLIAGMTEQQAITVFQRLAGVEFGSVLDRFR